MKLGGNAIKKAIDCGTWEAYRLKQRLTSNDLKIGPNSVDVTLHPKLLLPRYATGASPEYLEKIDTWVVSPPIDPLKSPSKLAWHEVDCTNGFTLYPGNFALGAVNERFDCKNPLPLFTDEGSIDPFAETYFAPMYEGRSTCGRIGLMSHITAGFGDHGFGSSDNETFVLEIYNAFPYPLIITSGMRIGQVAFEAVIDPIVYEGAYKNPRTDGPVPPVLGPMRF